MESKRERERCNIQVFQNSFRERERRREKQSKKIGTHKRY